VEVFKLEANMDDHLVETQPLDPEFKQTVGHVDNEMSLMFTPQETGMYRLVTKSSQTYFAQSHIYIKKCLYIITLNGNGLLLNIYNCLIYR